MMTLGIRRYSDSTMTTDDDDSVSCRLQYRHSQYDRIASYNDRGVTFSVVGAIRLCEDDANDLRRPTIADPTLEVSPKNGDKDVLLS